MSWITNFDPNPSWYKWSVHIVTVVSTIIFPIGIYCIFHIMPKTTDKLFKRLLASSLGLSYLCQWYTAAGAIPNIALPLCGGYPLGFLTHLGMGTCFMTGGQVSFIANVAMFTNFLFFYRQHVVNPMPKWVNYSLIAWFIFSFTFIPIPAHVVLCGNLDLTAAKSSYIEDYPILCGQIPNYWNESVIFFGWNDNNFLKYLIIYDLYFINFSIASILFFVHRLSSYLKTNAVSEYHRKFHHSLIRSLLSQSFVHYSLMLLPSAVIVTSCYLELPISGLANLSIVMIATSDPCGILALLFMHRDYRTAIIRFSKKLWMRLNGHVFSSPFTVSVLSGHHSLHSGGHS